MNRHELTTSRTEPLPPAIRSPRAKLVYLYLEAADGAAVDELNQILSMKKIAILSVLRSLSNAGLVEKTGVEYVVRS